MKFHLRPLRCPPPTLPRVASQVKLLTLLTMKPVIFAANVSEGDLADQGAKNKHVQAIRAKAQQDKCEVIVVSAQVESELISLSPEERVEFLRESVPHAIYGDGLMGR